LQTARKKLLDSWGHKDEVCNEFYQKIIFKLGLHIKTLLEVLTENGIETIETSNFWEICGSLCFLKGTMSHLLTIYPNETTGALGCRNGVKSS